MTVHNKSEEELIKESQEISFNYIFNLADVQHLQDLFADAHGVASIITDTEGKPITQPSNFTHLCENIIRKTEKGCANCYQSDAVIGRHNPAGAVVQACLSGGLWDAGASITVGGKHIANWLIRQVLNKPVLSAEPFQKIANLLFVFANELSEKAFGNMQLSIEIAKKEKAIAFLQELEENLSTTLQSIGDGVIYTDKNGLVMRMNPVAETLCGWNLIEALGKSLSEVFTIINAETRQAVDDPVKKVLKKGRIVGLANHTVLVSRNGTEYQIADSAAAVKNKEGEITGVILVFSDITETYAAQRQVEESEYYLRETQIIAQLGTYTLEIATGNWTSSEVLDKIFGIEKHHDKSVEGWVSIIHPDWQKTMTDYITNEVIRNRKRFDKEYPILFKSNKEVRWVHGLGKLEFDEQGNPIRMLGTIRDITERKLIEDNLQSTIADLQKSQAIAHIGSWKLDIATNVFTSSDEELRMLGFPSGLKPTFQEISDRIIPEDRQRAINTLNHSIETGEPYSIEITVSKRDTGELRNIQSSAEIQFDIDGKAVAVMGVNQDITERKQAEEAIVEREERFRTIFENSMVGESLTYTNGTIKANQAFCEITGYTEEELSKMEWKTFTHPEDVAQSESVVKSILSGERSNARWEKRYIKKNGDCVWVDISTTLQRDKKGNPLYFITSMSDTTQRKNAEAALLVSERNYKLIAENVSDLITRHTPDGIYTYLSASCQSLLGYEPHELIGINPYTLFHPEDVAAIRDTHIGVVVNKDVNLIQYRIKRKDGQYIWIETNNKSITDSVTGEVTGIICVSRDISERKRLENIREIQYNIAKAVVTSESIENLLEFARSELSRFFDTTNFFAALYNAKKNTLKKIHWIDEVDKFEEWDASNSFSGYVVKTGKLLLLNKQEIVKLGLEQNIKIIGTPAECWMGVPLIVDKKVIGVMVIQSYTDTKAYDASSAMLFNQLAYDLSVYIEKTKILQDLNVAKRQAEESDRLKSSFLENMSHEIRTPMNGILGFADLLKTPSLSGEQQQEYIKIIQKSGNRMLNIINDIVDISKIEAGLMKLEIKESNINEQIEYIYTFFKPEVEAKGLTISFRTPLPAKEAIIKTDREKLYAILTNLVKNAIKYTPSGSIEFGYTLINSQNSASLQCYVKDTGIGIPKDRQEAIFERFIQADIADKMARQGAGLGLSITKVYVEMLSGEIWVESQEGVGSTFYFTLPYTAQPVIETITHQASPSGKTDNVKKLKILIAEDDEVSEMLIDLNVKTYGKVLLKVKTGVEAVKACRDNPDIDLILMDIRMPELDGYKATQQIREFNKEVVIIAQTAYGLSGDREKSIESGCNDYITKPIAEAELRALIQKYFGE